MLQDSCLSGHSTGDYVKINIGPSHPAMHGTLRVIAWTDGETVVKADPEIGYLHRGVEKMGGVPYLSSIYSAYG